MPVRTKLAITITLLTAAVATVWAAHANAHAWLPFWLLSLAVLLSSGLKVNMPQSEGSMSATFPFLLLGILELSPLQAILLAGISVAAQCRLPVRTWFKAVQISFNLANAMASTACAYGTYSLLHHFLASAPALALSSIAYFFWTTGMFAIVIATSEGKKPFPLWRAEFPWYLPFYIVGAILASSASWLAALFGWGTALLLIPAIYTLYRAYMGQLSRLKERQQHLEETEALHLRTIEGLAMAIEAKDQGTHEHLFRVKNYVQAIGEALHLDKLSMQALQTAAFLHDIGKLAVPEHIINKPGKLTPEEFEKMKIHPVVGADILQRVRFPYPVVPIVRSHHEWWNGTGYPDGLKRQEIPIGARVLTVVDCFDALVSDRPYRKGMSNQQALAIIRSLSGKQFDPAVVQIFEACHSASEQKMEALLDSAFSPLNTEVEVWRGVAPGAGFEAGSEENPPSSPMRLSEDERTGEPPSSAQTLKLVAAATQEAQTLYEITQSVAASLSTAEIVSLVAARLHRLLPYAVCVLHVRQGDELLSRFREGDGSKLFSPAPVQLGEGISGWVAQSGKPILNGNAAMEPGSPVGSNGSPIFRSAMAIPLFDLEGQAFSVLSLYSLKADIFTRDHLRILQAMEPKLSLAFSNALQFRRAEVDSETDFITGLPNARRVFLQVDAELDNAQKTHGAVTLITCDLNGFKEVNDSKGQLIGNRLLGLIADEFRQLCEQNHMIARMGGDEFVFLLPGTDEQHTLELSTSIHQAVAAAGRRAGHGIRVSASLGTACFPNDGASAENLLSVANRRMYLAKQRHYSFNTSLSVEPKLTAAPLVACNE